MKFKITKKVDLGYLGDEWKDCHLEFRVPSYGDIQDLGEIDESKPIEASKKALEVLGNAFVSGKGVDEKGEKVDIKKEDLKDLPVTVLTKAMTGLTEPAPKG